MTRLRRCVTLLTAGLALACVPSKSTSETAADESSSTADSGTDGSETETEAETETGEPECDYDGYVACRGEAFAAHDACMATCDAPDSCAGVACGWSCRGEQDWAIIACAEQAQCPAFISDTQQCEAECHTEAGECPLTPDCDAHDCIFAEMVCVAENCHPCEIAALDYEYADDCEIERAEGRVRLAAVRVSSIRPCPRSTASFPARPGRPRSATVEPCEPASSCS